MDQALTILDWNRFDKKVDRTGDCHIWMGALNTCGYGHFRVRGRTERAHRIAWWFEHGKPVPAHLVVIHECDDPRCVNPAHLRLGTQHDNIADMVSKGRHASANQHGENCHTARLTWEDIREIREWGGVTNRYLAYIYGVSPTNIGRIKKGTIWREQENRL